MAYNQESYGYKNISSAATTQVDTGGGTVKGVFVSSTSSGTFALYDNATGTTTNPITGTVTPTAPAFYEIDAGYGTGLVCVTAGTINCTVMYA